MWVFSRPILNQFVGFENGPRAMLDLSDAEHIRGPGRSRPSAQNEPSLLFVDDLRLRVDPLPLAAGLLR
jgi:hypothetical protein